ncbi:MAG: VWA domain-containing protein [Bacteroidales bacterium]|nr:VWA domain-containing protein [Candidatus Cryptobacteroides onthequi]
MKNTFKKIFAALAVLTLSVSAFSQGYDAIQTSKKATVNPDGTVTLTLDTWVNGYESNLYVPTTVAVPLDIVLVLDVSGSMDDELSGYVAVPERNYSYDDIRNAELYYKDGSSYYEVEGTSDYNWGGSRSNYRIYYSKGWDNTSYLSGTGTTTTRPTGRDNDDIQWTGVLYKKQKKIDALKDACKVFVNNIQSKATEDDVEHRIALVKFAGTKINTIGNDTYKEKSYTYNNTQIVNNLTNSYSTVRSNIDKLIAAGATSVDYGMEHAKTIIDAAIAAKATDASRKDSKQIVVMFTDGEPNHDSNFDTSVATNAITASNALKSSGVTVYTVGVFDNPGNQIHTYMDYVSSNNTTVNKMPGRNFPIKAPSGKYMTATSAEELTRIFTSISKDVAAEGGAQGAGVDLTGKTVTLKDIVTPEFTIPDIDGDYNIVLKEVKATDVTMKDSIGRKDDGTHAPISIANCYNYTWATTGTTITPDESKGESVSVDKSSNTLKVEGIFARFSEDWVGVTEDWHSDSDTPISTPHLGSKLVIEFTIIPSDDWAGGKIKTNDDNSGVYVDNTGVTNPEKRYITPAPIYMPANITIKKSGMNPGESAIFEVTASGYDGGVTKKYTIAMTANEAGETKDAVILKVDIVKNPNPGINKETGELNDPGFLTYTVRETSWSWAYDSKPTGEGADVATHSITRTVSDDPASLVFVFENKPKTTTPKHGESNANNIFAK